MTESNIEILKQLLIDNRFTQIENTYSSPLIVDQRGEVRYTFMGSGWVKKYYSESWHTSFHTPSEFIGDNARSLY